jgi:AraC-like DNA-binding protein
MLIAIKKGANLTVVSSPEEPLESIFVNTVGIGVEKIFNFFEIGGVFIKEACVLDLFLEIHDKLGRMEKITESDTYIDVLAILFKMLSVAHRNAMFPTDGGERGLAERVRGYIDSNIYSDISLDVIAEELGISKIHVIRVFKQKYGIPPMQYMMTRKIEISKSLLRSTVMPIAEIAELLKFSNAQHFSGTFKNAVGCTPNKYRKNEK